MIQKIKRKFAEWRDARRSAKSAAQYEKIIQSRTYKYLKTAPKLQRVFSSSDLNFWQFVDPLDITAERWFKVQAAVESSNFSVGRDEISSLLKEAAAAYNSAAISGNVGPIGLIHARLSDMSFRIDTSPQEKYLISLGCELFLCDGENPEVRELWAFDKKMKAAESDPDLRAFFLSNALECLKKSVKSYPQDTPNSSKVLTQTGKERLNTLFSKSVRPKQNLEAVATQ